MAEPKKQSAAPAQVPGRRAYRLTQPCFHEGSLLEAGEIVVVDGDFKPSRTWELVEDAPVAAPVEVQKPEKQAGRPSDKGV